MVTIAGQRVGAGSGTRLAAPGSGSAELLRGVRASLPVMVGLVPFALVLGAQAAARGFSLLEVQLLSALNFGGASEFAVLNLWSAASPPSILLVIAVTALVNSRHLLMGAVLAPRIRHLPRPAALRALFWMSDESWALSLADARRRAVETGPRDSFSLPFYMGLSGGIYLTWATCTTLGAALGPMLGDVERFGFDMAFVAVFLVLLRGMWRGAGAAAPWLVSLLVAAATSLLLPGAWYIVAGALAGLLAAVLRADASATPPSISTPGQPAEQVA